MLSTICKKVKPFSLKERVLLDWNQVIFDLLKDGKYLRIGIDLTSEIIIPLFQNTFINAFFNYGFFKNDTIIRILKP